MKFNKLIFLILALGFFKPALSDYLFFDLNGVLLKTSKLKAFKKLGIEAIAYPNLKTRLFEFMHFIDTEKSDEDSAAFGEDKLPSFLCNWQKGKLTCKEVADHIINEADKNCDFFNSTTEQKLIKRSAELFLPENNITINKTIPSTVNLVKKCKAMQNEDGQLKHKVFLTSNFDTETFELVKEEFPHIIELFDADKIIISGEITHIKPEAEFFDYIIKKFDLDPKKCHLIDDTPANIEGAKKYGINGIHYRSTLQTTRELKKAKIL